MSTRTQELRKKGARSRARGALIDHLGTDPMQLVDQLAKAGLELAHAEAEYHRLADRDKSLLAQIEGRIARSAADKPLSETKLERMALADPEYITHLGALADARKNREILRVTRDTLERRHSWLENASWRIREQEKE